MSRKHTHEEFLAIVKQKHSDISILSEYDGRLKRVKCRCQICGYEWSPPASSLIGGHGCPGCAKKKNDDAKRKSQSFFEKQVYDANPNVRIIGEYINMDTRILTECNLCGRIWNAAPRGLVCGMGCTCVYYATKSDWCRRSHDDYVRLAREVNPDITIISTYRAANKKVDVRCNLCGREWSMRAQGVLDGRGCAVCRHGSSHGERHIARALDNLGITYEHSKQFDGLVGVRGRKLSYDFYIPSNNTLIEFQGVQHERPVERYGGETQFAVQVEHDRRKRKYADGHGIQLIEIWYYQMENIDDIIKSLFSTPVTTTVS